MRILSRYVFRQTAGALVLILVSLTGVTWIAVALRQLDLMTTQGQNVLSFLAMTTLAIPSMMALIAPIALLIASIHVLNRLNGDSELIVMAAGGMPAWSLLRPLGLLALVVAIGISFVNHVAGPWVLKPRSEASAIGIKLIDAPGALWPILDSLGDQQSSFLLENFIPGDVYHVDSVVSEREVVFSSVSRYGQPPMAVAQKGGIFTTYLLPGESDEAAALRDLNRELIDALGLVRGVSHAEFIRAGSDGHFYFLECAARVGGAYISEMVEIATGINLWREWARIEIAGGKEPYRLPAVRSDYAGLILSLARQEDPDTSAYNDPEIALRLKRRHHAGLVLRSSDPARIQSLLENYSRRFAEEFLAIEPPGTKPAA